MCKVILTVSLTLFGFGLVFQNGNSYGASTSECPVGGVSSLIYFDTEQLNLLSLQQGSTNVIHRPMLCAKGTDEECSKQECCEGEVPCCFNDPNWNQHVRKCGCKKAADKKCTFPAPLAILASECHGAKRNISACLRENGLSFICWYCDK